MPCGKHVENMWKTSGIGEFVKQIPQTRVYTQVYTQVFTQGYPQAFLNGNVENHVESYPFIIGLDA